VIAYDGRLALVTGASSGLGALFAQRLAARGMSVIIAGRDRGRLEKVAERVLGEAPAVSVESAIVDLARPEGVADLLETVGERPVEVLVNNAGFGTYGAFADADADRELQLVAVNVAAVVALTRALLPGMLERRSGGVLNVASTIAFQPAPRQAVYGASKAFVLSFSEAVRAETRRTGVHITAVAPGPTRTRFVADLDAPEASRTRVYRRLGDPEPVVDAGLRALERDRSVVVPGWSNALTARAARLLPRGAVTRVSSRLLDTAPDSARGRAHKGNARPRR
jgi:short-subunit dehydrogenase